MKKCNNCGDFISDDFEICYDCSNPSESNDEKLKVEEKKSIIKNTKTEIPSENLWGAIYNVPLGMKIANKPRKKLASDDIHPYWSEKGITNPYSMAIIFSIIRIIFFTILIVIVSNLSDVLIGDKEYYGNYVIIPWVGGIALVFCYLGWLAWFLTLIKYVFQRIFYKVK